MFYTSFGDRLNTDLLKSSKFHKLMIEALIEKDPLINDNQGLSKTELDLIFYKTVRQNHKKNSEITNV
jgi:hypothetical protein